MHKISVISENLKRLPLSVFSLEDIESFFERDFVVLDGNKRFRFPDSHK
jgi:hypothetical protein